MNVPGDGIPYWDAKRVALRAIFGTSTDIEVIKKIVPVSPEGEDAHATTLRRIHQMYPQWGTRKPTKIGGPKAFFEWLGQFCRPGVPTTGQNLIDDDIGDFLARFNETERRIALASLNDLGKPHRLTSAGQRALNERFGYVPGIEDAEIARATGHLNNHFPVFHSAHDSAQTVRMAIDSGQLNSDRYYLSPDAAASWLELINSPDYPSYLHCLEGLQKLVAGKTWRNIIQTGGHSRVVMLGGGGAPSKDLLFVENILSLLPQNRYPLRYVLIDLSSPLLIDSHRFLLREKERHGWSNDVVTITTIAHDILKLRGCAELLVAPGNCVWACTGGTIGNVREDAFFNSLNTRATSGDILLLTADTFDGESLNDFRMKILGKYEHEAMRNFLSSPLGTVLQLEKSAEAIIAALRRVQILVNDDVNLEHSNVVGSRYVEFSIQLRGRLKPLILLNSTRYSEKKLIDHVHGYGWRHLETTASSSNKDFKQFLFRRT